VIADQDAQWAWRRVKATEGILMDFVTDQVTSPDGSLLLRNYLSHPNAVGVIAQDDQGRVAVERQYRHPVRRRLVEAPAGLCDQPGEAALAAAQRELAEELGLAASWWRVLVDVYATPGSSTQATRIFLACQVTPVARPAGFVLEGEEAELELEWVAVEELVAAVFAGQIMNPTLVIGVLALRAAEAGPGLDGLRPA
jgi:ADP-ribose pyrophosphatase